MTARTASTRVFHFTVGSLSHFCCCRAGKSY